MKKYFLLLFLASLCINNTTKTISLKKRLILGSGSVVISLFALYKAYNQIYSNSLLIVKKDQNKQLAKEEWKQIPFFKRYFIAKEYFGKWVFTPLLTIANTYYEKEQTNIPETRVNNTSPLSIKSSQNLFNLHKTIHEKNQEPFDFDNYFNSLPISTKTYHEGYFEPAKRVDSEDERKKKTQDEKDKKNVQIKKFIQLKLEQLEKKEIKETIIFSSFQPLCNKNIITVDYLNQISADFKTLSREESICMAKQWILEMMKKKIAEEEGDDDDKKTEKENTTHKTFLDNTAYDDTYLHNWLKNNFSINQEEKNIEKTYYVHHKTNMNPIVNTFRLQKIITLTNASVWKIPEIKFLNQEKNLKELVIGFKKATLAKKYPGLTLEAIKGLVAIALSTGLSRLNFAPPYRPYDQNDQKYILMNLEDYLFSPCSNQKSKTGMSAIDIVGTIFETLEGNIKDEGLSWLVQFYHQLIQNPQEWEAFRKGTGVTIIPLHKNTAYDEELFGKSIVLNNTSLSV